MKVITDKRPWSEALTDIGNYDFYHTYDYHQLSKDSDDADDEVPHLFHYTTETTQIALPLLIRQLAFDSEVYCDATSVYGYAGPVRTGGIVADADIERFQEELKRELEKLGVVTVFTRLHPVLNNANLLNSLGSVDVIGKTATIDLHMDSESQWRAYRSNLRRDIKSLIDSGLECEVSTDQQDLGDFVRLYADTMQRRDVGSKYLFSQEYFKNLVTADNFSMHLFVCRLDDKIICGGLFSSCRGIVQYHLSGTDQDHYELAPTKLMLDTVRHWANDNHMDVFHLGGGIGAAEDSLFNFKKGFSNRVNEFKVWKWILSQSAYSELCEKYEKDLEARGAMCLNRSFFPYYKAPSSVAT